VFDCPAAPRLLPERAESEIEQLAAWQILFRAGLYFLKG